MFTVKSINKYSKEADVKNDVGDEVYSTQMSRECSYYVVDKAMSEEHKQGYSVISCHPLDTEKGVKDAYNYRIMYEGQHLYIENENGQTVDAFHGHIKHPVSSDDI